ncbi:Wzz/FepE/Etk N-terminal domain-containing protein [Pontibacter litorisediminis]|uniref:Wzz/FepE/Etk N-terminal domain-containing protein n=1 Tax=Pontibacter litorisediminis TaxID=1846260 RepID=UPI0023ED89AF|nr:Wzz/FepE/Etk N-terminal domain-containing protein [Pontibacter litorisediminis]
MMRPQLQNKHDSFNSDEIDIRVVLRSIQNGFRNIFYSLKRLTDIILKRIVVVALLVLVGLGLAFAIYKTVKPYYTSTTTLVLAEIRNQFVENQLNRLSIMIKEDNYEAVAEDLDITIDAAREIKDMSFSNLDQERIAEDSVLTGSPFEIELSLYNNTLFSSMETALANYLENNRYFSKQKLIRQKEVESMIKKLQSDISALDSVKKTVASPRGPVNGFVYGEPIDPANLFRESITMYQKQVELEGDLEQLDNIQIVNGFAPRLRPTGPNLLKFLIYGGGIAFIVGVLVAVKLESKKKNRI